jgi:deaminated glutathione amidase
MSKRKMIAACQGEWTTDAEQNLTRMERFLAGIHRDWGSAVALASFTEFAVQGFDPTLLRKVAETVPGKSTDRLCDAAAKYGMWVCSGSMVERRGDRLYNTSLLISPQGKIDLKYEKTHPWCAPCGSENMITPGSEFPVCEVPGIGKVGIMICYDGFFPEVARALAFNGADLILWPTMSFHPLLEGTRVMAQARALENGCYVMAVMGTGQHVGLGLIGHSMIVTPDGVISSEAGEGESLLIDVIDPELAATVKEEGAKGILTSLRHLDWFSHQYPQYANLEKRQQASVEERNAHVNKGTPPVAA